MPTPDIENCLNTHCPWSGKPIQADSLTEYKGQVVGFCNTGCRDKFEQAVGKFEELLTGQEKAPTN
ncbi:MAG: glutathione S-transferase [Gammaproteobacteria bacterium]|nr:glutathione S-transferase [Gammaproteobacteria bacterium]